MKIYAIANEVTECCGQGDYETFSAVRRQGFYGTGGFPPAFTSKEAAEKHMAGMEYFRGKVVEMDLVAEPSSV